MAVTHAIGRHQRPRYRGHLNQGPSEVTRWRHCDNDLRGDLVARAESQGHSYLYSQIGEHGPAPLPLLPQRISRSDDIDNGVILHNIRVSYILELIFK